jgi:hypothetical protein
MFIDRMVCGRSGCLVWRLAICIWPSETKGRSVGAGFGEWALCERHLGMRRSLYACVSVTLCAQYLNYPSDMHPPVLPAMHKNATYQSECSRTRDMRSRSGVGGCRPSWDPTDVDGSATEKCRMCNVEYVAVWASIAISTRSFGT